MATGATVAERGCFIIGNSTADTSIAKEQTYYSSNAGRTASYSSILFQTCSYLYGRTRRTCRSGPAKWRWLSCSRYGAAMYQWRTTLPYAPLGCTYALSTRLALWIGNRYRLEICTSPFHPSHYVVSSSPYKKAVSFRHIMRIRSLS